MLTKKRIVLMALLAAAVFAVALAPLQAKDQGKKDTPNPYLKPDESWISISGTAVATRPSTFTLDYGTGTITVEMDDWDWYAEGYKLLDGDKVTVYGEIDDDTYETTKIEASSVFVENLGAYFYASAADEEYDDDYDYWVDYDPIVVGETVVRGTVTDVDGREFTIDAGPRRLTVDTSTMAYNPMDEMGYQKIDVGDYVSVSGEMEDDFFEKRELMADSVVTLEDD